jgi:Fcf1
MGTQESERSIPPPFCHSKAKTEPPPCAFPESPTTPTSSASGATTQVHAENRLIQYVTSHKGYLVATCDRELRQRIRQILGVPLDQGAPTCRRFCRITSDDIGFFKVRFEGFGYGFFTTQTRYHLRDFAATLSEFILASDLLRAEILRWAVM